jgi:hypothetical protein
MIVLSPRCAAIAKPSFAKRLAAPTDGKLSVSLWALKDGE